MVGGRFQFGIKAVECSDPLALIETTARTAEADTLELVALIEEKVEGAN